MPTPEETRALIDQALTFYVENFYQPDGVEEAAREYLADRKRDRRVVAALEAGIPAPNRTGVGWRYFRESITNFTYGHLTADARWRLTLWYDSEGAMTTWPTLAAGVLAAADAAGIES